MQKTTIAVIGLGYVGLPLAVAFGRHFTTIGFDIKKDLLECFRRHEDPMGELTSDEMKSADKLEFADSPERLAEAGFIIVATPTPIDTARQPDLGPLVSAAETAGRFMKRGATVVFESTVYPGVTEDICVPILEKHSGMTWKKDFYVGYSPERINPGDRAHTLETIVKVVAGDTSETLENIAGLYETIVEAGVFRTETIKEAEAAKVIENTQRDLNIALMNELALIFDKLGIDTQNVLAAAGSKWNFLPFRPGLVGGHCIGVDPYYLTYKAETMGYHPQVILAGRRINDNMGKFVAEKTVKLMAGAAINIRDARVAIMGVTFKENCADTRNTRVVDIIEELQNYGIEPLVHDPLADPVYARDSYGISLCGASELTGLDAVVVAVAHDDYRRMHIDELRAMLTDNGCLIDVKGMLDPKTVRENGIHFWRL